MTYVTHAAHEREPVYRVAPLDRRPMTLGDELRTVFAVIFGGWRVYALAIGFFVLLALMFVAVAPQRYTATTELLLEPKQKQVVSGGVVDNSMSNEIAGADILSVDSQIQVLQSDSVARELIASENLVNDPEFVGGESLLGNVKGALSRAIKGAPLSSASADPRLDEVLKEFSSRLGIKRLANTYVVSISFKSEDPDKAARIANRVAEIYVGQNAGAALSTTQAVAVALDGRLEALRDTASADSQAVEDYRRENDLIGTENLLVTEQQLRDLNNQLSMARVARVNAESSLAQAQAAMEASRRNGAPAAALDSPVLSQLQVNLSTLEVDEARLRSTLQARHPALIRLNEEKAALLNSIRGELARIIDKFQLAHQVALERESSIETQVKDLETRRGDLNVASVQLRQLERKAEASQSVYDTFLNRSKQVWEQVGLPNETARVISAAYPPARPSEPKASVLVPAAAVLGLIAGVGWVWLAYLMGMNSLPAWPRRYRD